MLDLNPRSEFRLDHESKLRQRISRDSKHYPKEDTREISPCGGYMFHCKLYRPNVRDSRGFLGLGPYEGVVYKGSEVLRTFVFDRHNTRVGWSLGHPDGHDYLITPFAVLRLTTGEVFHLEPTNHPRFEPRYWLEIQGSPCGTMFYTVESSFITGGVPESVSIYDFTDPCSALPRKVGHLRDSTLARWQADSTLLHGDRREHCLYFNKDWDDLTEAECARLDHMIEVEGVPEERLFSSEFESAPEAWNRD